MRALVYAGPVEYSETTRWNTPGAVWVSEADVLEGVGRMPCRDCGGTGHFPMPEEGLEDFCVACKGQGLELISV